MDWFGAYYFRLMCTATNTCLRVNLIPYRGNTPLIFYVDVESGTPWRVIMAAFAVAANENNALKCLTQLDD